MCQDVLAHPDVTVKASELTVFVKQSLVEVLDSCDLDVFSKVNSLLQGNVISDELHRRTPVFNSNRIKWSSGVSMDD